MALVDLSTDEASAMLSESEDLYLRSGPTIAFAAPSERGFVHLSTPTIQRAPSVSLFNSSASLLKKAGEALRSCGC